MIKISIALVFIYSIAPFLCRAQIIIDFENFSAGAVRADDLEKLDVQSIPYTNGFDKGRAIIDSAVVASGAQSLRIFYPVDGVGPGESGAQAPLKVAPRSEYYISYKLRFSDNFSWGTKYHGGKLPGLASDENCSGCIICDGTNGFTARLMWRKDGQLVLYLYSMAKKNRCGDDYDLLDSEGKPFLAERGEWIKVTQRVKINSEAESNGEVQVWLNDVEAISLNGLKFVTNGDLVDNLYFSTFFGGSGEGWQPGVDCYIWFDDLVISESREGVF